MFKELIACQLIPSQLHKISTYFLQKLPTADNVSNCVLYKPTKYLVNALQATDSLTMNTLALLMKVSHD